MGQSAPRESRFREVGMLISLNILVYGGLAHTYAKPLWNLIMIVTVGVIASMISLYQRSMHDWPVFPQVFTLSQLIIFACLKADPVLLRENFTNYYLFLFVFPMTLAYATIMTIIPTIRLDTRRPSEESFYSKLMDIFNIYPSLPYLFSAIIYMLALILLDLFIF